MSLDWKDIEESESASSEASATAVSDVAAPWVVDSWMGSTVLLIGLIAGYVVGRLF